PAATAQFRGVAEHLPEPNRSQNRLLARQGDQPEHTARPQETATSSTKPVTTHTTSSETAPFSPISARQASGSASARDSEQTATEKVGRRGAPMSPERVAIAAYLTDFAAELGDEAKP